MANVDNSLTQISKLVNREDPLLDFKWICPQPTLPFGLPSEFLEGVDISWNNVKQAEDHYGAGGYTVYPGSHTISAFNMTLYEDNQARALQWIMHWKSQIKDFGNGKSGKGFYNLPTVYKKDFVLRLLDSMNKPVIEVKLTGCWPTETSNWSLNYTNNGRITISQGFAIDDQEIKFMK